MISLKQILIEGRYDALIRVLVKDVLSTIKSKRRLYRNEYTLETKSYEKYRDIDADFKFEVTINYDENFKVAYDVSALSDTDELNLFVDINLSYFPDSFNSLLAELKGILRHELEHIAQDNFNSKQTGLSPSKGDEKGINYFLSDHEKPAFILGFNKEAKTKNKTWKEVALQYLKRVKNKFNLKNRDIETIMSDWIEYAKDNYPNIRN